MTRNLTILPILLCLLSVKALAGSLWQPLKNKHISVAQERLVDNATYNVSLLNEDAMKQVLNHPQGYTTIQLPTPSGNMRTFRIWPTTVLPQPLAAKYPDIVTYTGEDINDPSVTVKIDRSDANGFHAMVYNNTGTYLIDPVDNFSTGTYLVRYKNEERPRSLAKPGCQTLFPSYNTPAHHPYSGKTVGGYKLRTYRIAIACDHQYAQAAVGSSDPTLQQTLGKIVTSLNRINGVYERELAITMVLVDKEDTLIFVDSAADPYGHSNNSSGELLNLNQKICDSLIGNANYDVGHVFTTGAGGLSAVGCVCNPGQKAQSATGNSQPTGDGFDIDYVAHEIGHEFGADHTFNNNSSGACYGNANQVTAFEPGSGSTLMAYAGICDGDNLQEHSDAYFTAASLVQITDYISGFGGSCALSTATSNKAPYLPGFTSTYSIPYQTPFELTAPMVTDSVEDSITTFCWEQYNLGDFGKTLKTTDSFGPLFRSYSPDTSRTRVFPNIHMVLSGQKSNAGNDNAEGEKLPTVARFLTFRLTVRNIYQGTGIFQYPDDSIHLNVINTGRGFEVLSQGATGLKYIGNSIQSVSWDVANTTTSPINSDSVDIYLSTDGGYHWDYNLGRFANTGAAIITLPNPATTSINCRIKVKGAGNVFFNVNKADFTLISNPGIYGDIMIFPSPAHNNLTIVTGDKGAISAQIYDMSGKLVTEQQINSILDLDISMWPRGMYIIRMKDLLGQKTIKKFVVE